MKQALEALLNGILSKGAIYWAPVLDLGQNHEEGPQSYFQGANS